MYGHSMVGILQTFNYSINLRTYHASDVVGGTDLFEHTQFKSSWFHPGYTYEGIIMILYLSVQLSVHYRRSAETISPRDTRYSISGYRLLEARAWRFLCVSVIALATDMNTSVLDGLYKNQATTGAWALTFSGLQIAKELDS